MAYPKHSKEFPFKMKGIWSYADNFHIDYEYHAKHHLVHSKTGNCKIIENFKLWKISNYVKFPIMENFKSWKISNYEKFEIIENFKLQKWSKLSFPDSANYNQQAPEWKIKTTAIRRIIFREIDNFRHHREPNWGSSWNPPYITALYRIEGFKGTLNSYPIMPGAPVSRTSDASFSSQDKHGCN